MELATAIILIIGIPAGAVVLGIVLGHKLWNRDYPEHRWQSWHRK